MVGCVVVGMLAKQSYDMRGSERSERYVKSNDGNVAGVLRVSCGKSLTSSAYLRKVDPRRAVSTACDSAVTGFRQEELLLTSNPVALGHSHPVVGCGGEL